MSFGIPSPRILPVNILYIEDLSVSLFGRKAKVPSLRTGFHLNNIMNVPLNLKKIAHLSTRTLSPVLSLQTFKEGWVDMLVRTACNVMI